MYLGMRLRNMSMKMIDMKKILLGILLVGVIAGVIYLCSDGEDDHYDYKEVLSRPRDDAIRWNILYEVNVGDGLLKLEYPDCFELDDSICGDSDVTMSYKGEADLFLTASVIENKMHLNTDELADSMVNQINEEGNDTVTMQDMHDGYFYLTCEPMRTRYRSYAQYVVDHDLIYRLCLMYPSHFESKVRKLKEYVHGWNPKTKNDIMPAPMVEPEERMSVLKQRGGAHHYREFYIEEGDAGYHFMVYDSCHHNRQEIVFDADDYMNEGVPAMYAFVSPDKKYVYVVGDVLA